MTTAIPVKDLTHQHRSFLHAMFTTAVEGGIDYWAEILSYHWHHVDGSDDLERFYAKIAPAEGEWGLYEGADDVRVLTLDLAAIHRGAELFWKFCIGEIGLDGKEVAPAERKLIPETHYWRQWMVAYLTNGNGGDHDSIVADCIAQFGLFGKLVYS